jgi:hypothetical protein
LTLNVFEPSFDEIGLFAHVPILSRGRAGGV